MFNWFTNSEVYDMAIIFCFISKHFSRENERSKGTIKRMTTLKIHL